MIFEDSENTNLDSSGLSIIWIGFMMKTWKWCDILREYLKMLGYTPKSKNVEPPIVLAVLKSFSESS